MQASRNLALLVGAVAALSALAPAAAAPEQSVSLRVVRALDPNTRLYRLSFSGAISSGAAGQDITVLQQTCGQAFGTAIAGAQTRDGGAWNAEPASPAAVAASATYRARWNNVESQPVAIHPPMPIYLIPTARNRVRVSVQTGSVRQGMTGRIVLLQRLRGRTWRTVGRKRLAVGLAGGGGFTYEATFPVGRRWTVRGMIPAAGAAPCFAANATPTVRT